MVMLILFITKGDYMAHSLALFGASPSQKPDPSPIRPAAVSAAPIMETISKIAEVAMTNPQEYGPKTPRHVPAAAQPSTPPAKNSPQYLSLSSPESPDSDAVSPPSPPKRALKPANRTAAARSSKPVAFDFDEADPLKTPPSSKAETQKLTPVSKFIAHANDQTPDHTALPKTRQLQETALESAARRQSPERRQALERLDDCTRRAMQRSRILQFKPESGKVTGVLGWIEFSSCWPADMFQQVNRHTRHGHDPLRALLNLTHLDSLEKTEGGNSVKGKHIHNQYLHGACINRKTQVWGAFQKTEDCAKEAKYSTFFPLLRCSHQEIIDLVSQGLKTPAIANKGNLALVQPPECGFCVEIAMHNGIISTVIPILDYAVYEPKIVFRYDAYRDGAMHLSEHHIALEKVVAVLRTKLLPDSPEIRYQCANGDLIIDVAYFLKEAGYADCPIEKGILIRFPRNEVLK